MKAIVLIKIESGEIMEAFKDLKRIPSISKAYLTLGPYDVVLELQAPSLNQIGDLVAYEILNIPGVQKTCTCILVEGELGYGSELQEIPEQLQPYIS